MWQTRRKWRYLNAINELLCKIQLNYCVFVYTIKKRYFLLRIISLRMNIPEPDLCIIEIKRMCEQSISYIDLYILANCHIVWVFISLINFWTRYETFSWILNDALKVFSSNERRVLHDLVESNFIKNASSWD